MRSNRPAASPIRHLAKKWFRQAPELADLLIESARTRVAAPLAQLPHEHAKPFLVILFAVNQIRKVAFAPRGWDGECL
jgi:hypothetical protein